MIDVNGFDDDVGDDDHDDEDSFDDGGYMVMVMVIVKDDGEGGCGDDSGCDVEGKAWLITRQALLFQGHSLEGSQNLCSFHRFKTISQDSEKCGKNF